MSLLMVLSLPLSIPLGGSGLIIFLIKCPPTKIQIYVKINYCGHNIQTMVKETRAHLFASLWPKAVV